MIHPSAKIHPTAVLDGDVSVGPDAEIGALCYVKGPVEIGRGTKVYPNCVIGLEGEHKTKGPIGKIRIGANTIVRELTVVQRGTGDRETQIGEGCYIMDHCHVAHDCVVGDEVTMSPNVVLGGHTRVQRGATLGIGSIFHQFSTIGAFCMIGMGSVVTRDVPPFYLVAGNPATYRRLNSYGIKRAELDEAAFAVTGHVLRSPDAKVQALYEQYDGLRREGRKLMPLERSKGD